MEEFEELNEEKYEAYVVANERTALSDVAKRHARIRIQCDSTGNRRHRAACISALKRAIEKHYGVKLTSSVISYSETDGFLPRTSAYYRIVREKKGDA